MKRSVITIAAGKKLYVEYACNLANSFLYWNANTEIEFVLITDMPEEISEDLKTKINCVAVSNSEIGTGFSSKLDLYKYLNEDQNLFIDADCLIYGELGKVFTYFSGKSMSVIGHEITSGNNVGFCKSISDVLTICQISYYPIFVGSVYYFEKDNITRDIFTYAKELLPQYDQIGLIRLRDKENEEPLLGLSMAKYNQHVVSDDGNVKADRMFFEKCRKNILNGKARLWNSKHPLKPEHSSLLSSTPLIVHYNARFTDSYEYKSDIFRLNKVLLNGYSVSLANLYAFVLIDLPGSVVSNFKRVLKNFFRPAYTYIFGVREVKKSIRVIE